MTTKADFDAEQWTTLTEAPLLAGLRVVTADRGGTIRESVAIGRVYTEARRTPGRSEVVDALASSPPGVDPQRAAGEGDIAGAARTRLRDAVQILQEKGTPEDVEAYGEFVLSVAQAAAEAHKEGGFIGIGGKQVSDAEQAAIDEIKAELHAT